MVFCVNYSFNNGASTGTALNIRELRKAIYDYGLTSITQCTLSGTAEGELTTGDISGAIIGRSYGLFAYCNQLISVDMSNLDVSNVTDIGLIFDNCSSLSSIDISNWNTSNVTDMGGMFYNCKALTTLDLSNLDTSNVTNMNGMFYNCENLEHIYVESNWNTTSAQYSRNMFIGCVKLPNFNASYIDKTKAYAGTDGYLEYKAAPTPTPTVPEIHIGDTTISAIKLGDTEISKIYLGTEEL